MVRLLRFAVPFLVICASLAAQPYNATTSRSVGYNGWTTGWDTVHVVKNDIITLAVVPKLGGRVMQYDLGANKSLFVFNGSAVPASGNDVVGGFRVLPSPQSDFTWPAPPALEFMPYTCLVRTSGPDSAVLYLESQVEYSADAKYAKHAGLQFKRLITLYKASSRVKVEMTMLNKGTQSLTHGIWDITQTACASSSNCWVYFKRNPTSTLGNGKGYVHYASAPGGASQWFPNAAADNVMGVQFQKVVGKIGADCKAGWICFNDRATGYAYVKTFTYQEGKTYPDSGASVQVYTYADYNMLEVEVLGPLVTLAAGDSTKLVENWYAARSNGPVLAVNEAGLITKRLAALQTADTVTLTGTFGLFSPGKVKTQFCNATGAVISVADSTAVLPTDSLRVNNKLRLPAGAVSIRLAAFNTAGTLIGTLDSTAVPNPVAVKNGIVTNINHSLKASFSLTSGQIMVSVPFEGLFTTTVYLVDGRRIASFTGNAPYQQVLRVKPNVSNVLIITISGMGRTETRMVPIAQGR